MSYTFSIESIRLAESAFCLANPTRIKILKMISREKKMNFSKIHKELNIGRATAFQHLTVLRKGNYVKIISDDTHRNRKYYVISEGLSNNINRINFFIENYI